MMAEQRQRRRRIVAVGLIIVVLVGVSLTWVLARSDGNHATSDGRGGAAGPEAADSSTLPGSLTDDGGLAVSHDDYGNDWPLTIEEGVLRCDAGAVIFEASDKTYALNPEAQTRQLGVALAPVWAPNPELDSARMSITPLIEHGLALC